MFARQVILWFGRLGPGTVCCGSIGAAALLAWAWGGEVPAERWGVLAIVLFGPLLAWFPIRWVIETRRSRTREFFSRRPEPPQDQP